MLIKSRHGDVWSRHSGSQIVPLLLWVVGFRGPVIMVFLLLWINDVPFEKSEIVKLEADRQTDVYRTNCSAESCANPPPPASSLVGKQITLLETPMITLLTLCTASGTERTREYGRSVTPEGCLMGQPVEEHKHLDVPFPSMIRSQSDCSIEGRDGRQRLEKVFLDEDELVSMLRFQGTSMCSYSGSCSGETLSAETLEPGMRRKRFAAAASCAEFVVFRSGKYRSKRGRISEGRAILIVRLMIINTL
ncbi:unnamed protein product [Leuciscus chuanchicus]